MRTTWAMAVSVLAGACALEVPPLVARDAAPEAAPDASPPPDVAPPRDAAPDRAPAACPALQERCGDYCANLRNDPDHCGACGRRCAAGACLGGACVESDACAEGVTRCAARCVDTRTSASHCGACGRDCARTPGSDGACVDARCRCAPGYADCDGDAANGCETSTDDSPAHCGACGARCDASHGVLACEAGACVVRGCAAQWGDCDRDARNGCEAPLATTAHCGACGVACPTPEHASPVCVVGTLPRCGFVCEVGFADCDGDARNGCEADLMSAFRHCGGCNMPCNGNCQAGVCR